jgi:hypothetical protein
MKRGFDGFSAADHSLRLRRGSGGLPGRPGAVMARGNRREPIFRDDEDRRRFVQALES